MGTANRAPPLSLTPKDGARFGRRDRGKLAGNLSGTSSQVGNPRRGVAAPQWGASRTDRRGSGDPTVQSPTGTLHAPPALFSQERKVVGLCPTPHKLFVKSLTKNFSFPSTAHCPANPPLKSRRAKPRGIFLARPATDGFSLPRPGTDLEMCGGLCYDRICM